MRIHWLVVVGLFANAVAGFANAVAGFVNVWADHGRVMIITSAISGMVFTWSGIVLSRRSTTRAVQKQILAEEKLREALEAFRQGDQRVN